MANVNESDIDFIETHGTATRLGDMIEIEALKQVFAHTEQKIYLGALKNNIGHLDAAAGIVALIKTVLVLQSGVVPPMANFMQSNDALDLEDSPFTISKERQDPDILNYAGVSAFGVGGTNVHVILRKSPSTFKPVQTYPLNSETYAPLIDKSFQSNENLISATPRFFVPSRKVALFKSETNSTKLSLIIDMRAFNSATDNILKIKKKLSEWESGVRLLFVSQRPNPVNIGLHYMLRTLAKEHPEFSFRSLCFDATCNEQEIKNTYNHQSKTLWLQEEGVCFSCDGRELYKDSALEVPAHDLQNTINFAPQSICLITGAFGGIGQALAKWLVKKCQARLILTARLPSSDMKALQQKSFLKELETMGAQFEVIHTDMGKTDDIQNLMQQVHKNYNNINYVFHTAGLPGNGFLIRRDDEALIQTLNVKAQSALHIQNSLKEMNSPASIIYFSSLAAILGDIGQSDYVYSNAMLDALAENAKDQSIVSINWASWREAGMAVDALKNLKKTRLYKDYGISSSIEDLSTGLMNEEGFEAMAIAMQLGYKKIAICKQDLAELMSRSAHPPETTSSEPKNDATTQDILTIFSELLGCTCEDAQEEFYDMGGDSLLALRLIDIIKENYGVQISLQSIFTLQTAEALATYINESRQVE